MDIRNRRDVGHVGGDVSPNFSDSLYVVHSADWILTEIIRIYFQCPIREAQKIVASLNEKQIPVIAEVDGFVRVQNTDLKKDEQALAILYHKHPDKVSDTALHSWIGYSTLRGFKVNILEKLHEQALVHYKESCCSLYPKGLAYVEKHIDLHFVV